METCYGEHNHAPLQQHQRALKVSVKKDLHKSLQYAPASVVVSLTHTDPCIEYFLTVFFTQYTKAAARSVDSKTETNSALVWL